MRLRPTVCSSIGIPVRGQLAFRLRIDRGENDMGIEEKTSNAPRSWQEEREKQILFCLGRLLPGQALERWWAYGCLDLGDRRSYYRQTFEVRYEYDGSLPLPSPEQRRHRLNELSHLHAQGIYLNFLNWRGYRTSRSHVQVISWRDIWHFQVVPAQPVRGLRH